MCKQDKEYNILGGLDPKLIKTSKLADYSCFSQELQDREKYMFYLEELIALCNFTRRQAYRKNLKVEGILLPIEEQRYVERAFIDMFGHHNVELKSNGRPDYRVQGIPVMFSDGLEAGKIKFIININETD